MATTINSLASCFPFIESQTIQYSDIYEQNCHRIYSLAFWMTDNEITAEQLSANTFLRAFAASSQPSADQIDRAFLAEIRELMPVGAFSLNVSAAADVASIYGNVKRIHLERAVVQLPATERIIFLMHDVDGYEHNRIARLLGITEKESKSGLHQARMQVRSLIAQMS